MTTIFEIAARLQAAGAPEEMLLITVKATLILLIARLLLAVMPRASAATRHLLTTAALVAVATMPLLSLVVPAWEISTAPTAAAGVSTPRNAAAVGVTDAEESERSSTLGTAISIARATGVVPAEPLTAIQRATDVARSTWKGMIALAVIVAALLMLLHMTAGMIGVWHVTRSAEPLAQPEIAQELLRARTQLALGLDVRLLRSSRISVPVLWGVLRPVLLLPPDVVAWPAERLRVVLLHELSHLKRFDAVSLILTRLAVSLFWFHPLAWSLERIGRSECERACDDLVLAGGTKPSDYADHLLEIARSMPTFDPFRSVTLAMSRKSQLEGRLLSILQPGVARRVFSGRGVAIACALTVVLLAPLSAIRLTAEPPVPEKVEEAVHAAQVHSGSTVDVVPHIERIEDYLLTKLGKWDKRADRFAREPRNAEERYERAYDLYRADRYEEAAAAFRQAAREGHAPDRSLYNAACSYALMGDADRALSALDEAFAAGWDDFEKISEDSDFDPIRSDARFARLVDRNSSNLATRRLTRTVERYQRLQGSSSRPESADDWYDVGLDLLRLRRIPESIDAFQKALAAGYKNGATSYNIACAYSLGGDVPNGMLWLDRAIESGYSDDDKLRNDPDIALLRKQPGFEALREKSRDLEMRGCCGKVFDLFTFRSWSETVQHHRQMTEKYPSSGRAWFNLGYSALQDRDYATAHAAYQRTLQLGYRPGTSSYNVACTYALQGNREAAFDWLNRARTAGFDLDDYLLHDDDLDSLHSDPRWDALVASIEHTSDEHRKRKHRR